MTRRPRISQACINIHKIPAHSKSSVLGLWNLFSVIEYINVLTSISVHEILSQFEYFSAVLHMVFIFIESTFRLIA